MTVDYDFVVVGQGLAGTALAWWLRWIGHRILVIDREEPVTSSRVAAGLMTPITGQKLIPSWRFDECWPVAVSFYHRVEQESGATFLQRPAMLRLLSTQAESEMFYRRASDPQFRDKVQQPSSRLRPEWFYYCRDAFEMREGGKLDVARYLDASREIFRAAGAYRAHDFDVSRETEPGPEYVEIRSLGVRTRGIVFCQGIAGTTNPWFEDVQFKPAKGEILTLRIPGLTEQRVIHRGIWLAPLGDDLFQAGATYDWKVLDNRPTDAGREEILSQLQKILRLPMEVVGHHAAVRPIHRNQYPVLGRHPQQPRMACFNGLGSKGALHAPYFGRQLAEHLTGGAPIDRQVDLVLKTRWSSIAGHFAAGQNQPSSGASSGKRPRALPLTQRAQLAVSEVVGRGDIVIDATAGNGHDTQFLAELVGDDGQVHAFDIQEVALENTARRLAESGLANVRLWHHDHAELSDVLPSELTGRVAAIMFNLGYLPGGDKSVITRAESSGEGVFKAAALLKLGGIMTVLAYTGHDGGQSEADRIASILAAFPADEFEIKTVESQPGRSVGPRLFHVKRLKAR